MDDIVRGLVDPFHYGLKPPKFFDATVRESAAFKLRSTGTITCSTSNPTIICLHPGLGNVISWRNDFVDPFDMTKVVFPASFSGHVGTVEDRAMIKSLRSTGSGLRLSLLNSAEQNEGFFEAARVTFSISDMATQTSGADTTGCSYPWAYMQSILDIANYSTYLTGKLRDIHRYQFKCNSTNSEHPFTDFDYNSTIASGNTVNHLFVDETFDMVIIKVHGRVETGAPTMLMFDSVSNQEVVYKQNTALSRLMSDDESQSDWDATLAKTNYAKPAVQIS